MKTVMIEEVLNGWVVTVGCQKVCYISSDRLLNDLREYMHNAVEFEKRFIDSAVNKHLVDTGTPVVNRIRYQEVPPGSGSISTTLEAPA